MSSGAHRGATTPHGNGVDGEPPRESGRRPVVVAVTVSTNERRWLPECLASLLASQTRAVDLRVVLIDNASTDGSADLVRERFPTVRVIQNRQNEGFAGANNTGIRHAVTVGADYVFLVNPDTRTPPDLVRRLVDFMETWPEYGLVGPLQYEYTEDGSSTGDLNVWSREALKAGESHVFVHTWPNHPSGAGPLEGRSPRTLEHAYVQGSALLCRTSILGRVGLFDPIYHTYYEETDLCRRVRWAGWRVALLLDVGIQHYAGGGTRASVYRRRKMLRNKYYFLLTDPEWRWHAVARLVCRWIWLDLRRSGAVPADTLRDAVGDTTLGLGWVLRQVPRIVRRRRAHANLLRHGAGGPLRTRPSRSVTDSSLAAETTGGKAWRTIS